MGVTGSARQTILNAAGTNRSPALHTKGEAARAVEQVARFYRVDYVTAFSDDTSQPPLAFLQSDFPVKGGDNNDGGSNA